MFEAGRRFLAIYLTCGMISLARFSSAYDSKYKRQFSLTNFSGSVKSSFLLDVSSRVLSFSSRTNTDVHFQSDLPEIKYLSFPMTFHSQLVFGCCCFNFILRIYAIA